METLEQKTDIEVYLEYIKNFDAVDVMAASYGKKRKYLLDRIAKGKIENDKKRKK
ncbi:MAG: hypothetical protein PF487_13170 [Bacteroidales bacterium]|jgi:pentose-5-phosphate-3-epimerase|nr:hypothetical protein [Bacteroidales bacterium]